MDLKCGTDTHRCGARRYVISRNSSDTPTSTSRPPPTEPNSTPSVRPVSYCGGWGEGTTTGLGVVDGVAPTLALLDGVREFDGVRVVECVAPAVRELLGVELGDRVPLGVGLGDRVLDGVGCTDGLVLCVIIVGDSDGLGCTDWDTVGERLTERVELRLRDAVLDGVCEGDSEIERVCERERDAVRDWLADRVCVDDGDTVVVQMPAAEHL